MNEQACTGLSRLPRMWRTIRICVSFFDVECVSKQTQRAWDAVALPSLLA